MLWECPWSCAGSSSGCDMNSMLSATVAVDLKEPADREGVSSDMLPHVFKLGVGGARRARKARLDTLF